MKRGWLESIADRAQVPISEVQDVLTEHRITPNRPFRSGRTLTITSVRFSGEKTGPISGPFNFVWQNLGAGVWALTSEGNLVGKSSVIEVIRWALRGQESLQDDVEGWLKHVLVEFGINTDKFRVEFDVTDRVPKGALSRISETVEKVVEFDSKDGFATAMAEFFMKELDLDPIPAFENDLSGGGRLVEHGWPALSGIMYIGGTHQVLIGDVVFGGLPARLLHMYIGIPWAQTLMQARTVMKHLQHKAKARERELMTVRTAKAVQRSKFESDLQGAQKRLANLPDLNKLIDNTGITAEELPRLLDKLESHEASMRALRAEEDATLQVLEEDERTLQQLKEDQAAFRFFKGLTPKFCPRCDSPIGEEKLKAERDSKLCAVCEEPIQEEPASFEERIDAAAKRREASGAALKRVQSLITPLRKEHDLLSTQITDLKSALKNLDIKRIIENQRMAEIEVARLQGALEAVEVPEMAYEAPSDLKVINATIKEALERFGEASASLMGELNQEILTLGRRFGITELESVELTTAGTMKIVKGGQQTSFSKLTIGERLRLRIATSVALLRVGAQRGVGRHPGLLFIDSPGAEETADSDFSALVGEIVAVGHELPTLQVFITSARKEVTEIVPAGHVRFAQQGEYLW